MPCSFGWKYCYCYLLQSMWLEYITKLQEGCLRTCCKSVSQSGGQGHMLLLWVQTSSKTDKPTSQQITNKTLLNHRRGQKWPYCYAYILCTFIKCSQPYIFPFRNRANLELTLKTWNFKPWSPVQGVLRDFWGEYSRLPVTSSNLSSASIQVFYFLVHQRSCLSKFT
jgi:hypothetical protein